MQEQIGHAVRVLATAATLAIAIVAPTATAAPVPGTPVPVAPGVPGNGRAWELVTLADPSSAYVWGLAGTTAAGDRVAFRAGGSLPGSPSGELTAIGVASRGADGWTTTLLPPPRPGAAGFDGGNAIFSADLLTTAWVVLVEVEGGQLINTLFRNSPTGGYERLLPLGDTSGDIGTRHALSADGRRILVSHQGHLLPGDASRVSGSSIYELEGSDWRLVDVDSNGALVSDCGSRFGGATRDGLKVFFVSAPLCGPWERVFMRSGGETTEISASQCTLPDCGPANGVAYAGMTANGSSAYLATEERLTNDDLDSNVDLYRYDVASGALKRLSGRPESSETNLYLEQVAGAGSRTYFLPTGPLRPGEGVEGRRNLYLADDEGLHFIAAPYSQSVEISGDGRYALFLLDTPVGAGDGDESPDVVRYDAVTRDLTLISAGPGGRGNGPFAATLAEGDSLSEDGQSVAFGTAEPLLPEDLNDQADVYEWRDGELTLVSAGAPGERATYLGMTPDTKTLFFDTNATLLGIDRDGGDGDFYAARIGGGFPEATPPVVCTPEYCPLAGPTVERLERRAPASAGALGDGIALAPVDAAARRRLATRGWATLVAEVPAAGRLSARGKAKLGSRRRLVASGRTDVAGPGSARLRLELTPAARRKLAQGGRLRVDLVLRLSGLDDPAKVAFVLGGGR